MVVKLLPGCLQKFQGGVEINLGIVDFGVSQVSSKDGKKCRRILTGFGEFIEPASCPRVSEIMNPWPSALCGFYSELMDNIPKSVLNYTTVTAFPTLIYKERCQGVTAVTIFCSLAAVSP